MDNKSKCCHDKKKWYKEPLFLILIFISLISLSNIFLINFGISFLNPAVNKFWTYIGQTWWAILLGIIIGALIELFVPQSFMVKVLGKSKKSIILSVLLGFLASACSHGILVIAFSLYKKGASTASTLAFLLAAPWANIAITILLFSLFGLKALFIVLGALLIAIVSGFIFQLLEKKGIIESNKNNLLKNKETKWKLKGFKESVKELFNSSLTLSKMVVWWVLLGFLMAAIIGAYLPDSIFDNYFGPNILGLAASLLLATVMEVCSEGTAPMAFELFKKTGAFGNSFVFLQAGVVTDFTEIGIITTNIGKRAAIAMILVCVPLVILSGFLLNNIK
jgi:uncharacterized membrane protein YraQ (UPF0718 family)